MRPPSGPVARRLIVGWAGVLVIGIVSASPTLILGAPLGALFSWHGSLDVQRRLDLRRGRNEVIELVDQVIQRLKTGSSLSSAVAACGLDDLVIEQAVPSSSTVEAHPEHRLLATTLLVLTTRGGSALPSLERLSDTLRSSAALAMETDTQAGQATASAMALAALPGLFIVALAAAQQSLRQFYLFEVAGTACLLGAAVLSYAGWSVMQRVIESVR